MTSLFVQFQSFGLTILLGIILGFIFIYYQLCVRCLHPSPLLLFILDVVIWLLLLIIVFRVLIWINFGEIRSYVFLGLIVGILIFYRKISPVFIKPLSKGANYNILIIKKAVICLVKPIKKSRDYLRNIGLRRNKSSDDEEENEEFR